MKRLPFYFWVSLALASCQGGKEAVNQALPVIDMNEDYPEKEIVLQGWKFCLWMLKPTEQFTLITLFPPCR